MCLLLVLCYPFACTLQGLTLVLAQAAGWIVIILFGFIFALLAVFLVWVDIKFAGAVYNAEQFNCAGRSIGAGLLAVDIVSLESLMHAQVPSASITICRDRGVHVRAGQPLDMGVHSVSSAAAAPFCSARAAAFTGVCAC